MPELTPEPSVVSRLTPSRPRDVIATVDAGAEGSGLYRTDDGGKTWARSTTERRPTSRGNEAVAHVHPKDPNTLIVTDVVSTNRRTPAGHSCRSRASRAGTTARTGRGLRINPDIML